MDLVYLLPETFIHPRQAADEGLSPRLPHESLSQNSQASRPKSFRQISPRHFLAVRPLPLAGLLNAPQPIPIAKAIGHQNQDVTPAAAGHAPQERHLLIEAVVLQDAGIEDEIVGRLPGLQHIALNEIGQRLPARETLPGV